MNWSKKIFACSGKLSWSGLFYSAPQPRPIPVMRERWVCCELCNVTVWAAPCIWLWGWLAAFVPSLDALKCFSFISFCLLPLNEALLSGSRPWLEYIITMGTAASISPWECGSQPPRLLSKSYLCTFPRSECFWAWARVCLWAWCT